MSYCGVMLRKHDRVRLAGYTYGVVEQATEDGSLVCVNGEWHDSEELLLVCHDGNILYERIGSTLKALGPCCIGELAEILDVPYTEIIRVTNRAREMFHLPPVSGSDEALLSLVLPLSHTELES